MKFTIAAVAAGATLLSCPTAATAIPSSYYSDMSITGSIYSFDANNACDEIFYTAGACGLSTYFTTTVPNATAGNMVAISASVFDQFGADQHDALCGRTIEITGKNGVTRTAIIADRAGADIIDMCLTLWEDFGGVDGDGTEMHDIKWKLVE